MKKLIYVLLFLTVGIIANAQTGEKVQLIQAGSLEGTEIKGEEVRILIGNVIFKHEGALLYCDTSYQYDKRNELECFGHVRMVQGDTIVLTGNKLRYNGNTKKAIVTNNVVLKDKKMTLNTDLLEYDTKMKLATYVEGGKIVDEENTLTSKKGYYNTSSKIVWFKEDVYLVNEKQKYTLTSDTLQYNTVTKIATFRGPSRVTKENDILIADQGDYDTEKGQSLFTGRARVITGDAILDGDKLSYNEFGKYGIAEGNVVVTSEQNNTVIYGDKAFYWGKDGIVKVVGKPLVKSKMDTDTLYMIADTLISVDRKNPKDTTIKEKYLQAFHNVKIYKQDLQASCDSLIYNMKDSIIYLFKNPVLWSEGNQITADSINIQLKDKKIHQLNANLNSLVISQDTARNFNQVKGKKLVAYFIDDKINRVNISGNGQSIYYALEDGSTKLYGVNKTECSNINVKFINGEVRNISFINKPDAKFIPPHEIVASEIQLKGFKWRSEERPIKEQVLGIREKKEEETIQIPYSPDYKLVE